MEDEQKEDIKEKGRGIKRESLDWRNQPLGLPKGSVRAIIALVAITTACYLALTGATDIPDWLNTIVSVIVGFYFGQKVAK
ncbi:MAG TPA: hypothetical protein ENF24_00220 [Methanosarcinales archaeon]|nr:hypothetical protein [Methanosarcinales archaeon]